jgi:hypothetical protein
MFKIILILITILYFSFSSLFAQDNEFNLDDEMFSSNTGPQIRDNSCKNYIHIFYMGKKYFGFPSIYIYENSAGKIINLKSGSDYKYELENIDFDSLFKILEPLYIVKRPACGVIKSNKVNLFVVIFEDKYGQLQSKFVEPKMMSVFLGELHSILSEQLFTGDNYKMLKRLQIEIQE